MLEQVLLLGPVQTLIFSRTQPNPFNRRLNQVSPAYLIWVDPWVKVAQMGISTEERLRFKGRTFHAPNLMHKLLTLTYFNW